VSTSPASFREGIENALSNRVNLSNPEAARSASFRAVIVLDVCRWPGLLRLRDASLSGPDVRALPMEYGGVGALRSPICVNATGSLNHGSVEFNP